MLNLNKIYSPKQMEVLRACRSSDWFMLINHGAKRSGKTQVDNDLFLQELIRVRGIANDLGIDTPQYILAGYSLGNIQDNILTELSNKYGFEFKFDKYNNFMLFGVKVVQTSHGSISGLGRIRGMTSFGAYINEASLANQEVFDEIKARCSGPGARIIADTNPDQARRIVFDRYLAGVDWGWEHFGAIVVIGVKGDSYYIIEEHAAQHKHIGEWISVAKDIIGRYGNIPFYCDPARTEHIAAFNKAGIRAYLANNRVLSGIEEVSTLMTNRQFFIVYEQCPRFREEIYKYVWKKNTGEPLRENDDVLCAIRYGIHSDMTVNSIDTPNEMMKQAKKLKGML